MVLHRPVEPAWGIAAPPEPGHPAEGGSKQPQPRREQERLAWERSERRDAELKLINGLERQAGAWFRARLLHRYVHAPRRAMGQSHIEAKRGDEPVDFFAWAVGYVNQVDPLHQAARNTDLLGGVRPLGSGSGRSQGCGPPGGIRRADGVEDCGRDGQRQRR